MTESNTTETTETRALRITIEYDEWGESPGGWEWGFRTLSQVPLIPEWGEVLVGSFNACSYAGPSGNDVCFFSPLEHEELSREEWEEEEIGVHEFRPPREVQLIEYDTRGPYSTMHLLEWGNWENWERAGDTSKRANVRVLGWERDRRVFPDPLTEEELALILPACLEEWNMWLRGDVYRAEIEEVGMCSCCNQETTEEVGSCAGLYGEQGVRDFLGEYLSEEEVESAQVVGSSSWLL